MSARNINPHLARSRQQQGQGHPPHQQPQIIRTTAQEANYGVARNVVLQGSQQSRPPQPRLPPPPHGARSGVDDRVVLDDEDDEEEEEDGEEEPDTSDEEDAEENPEQAEEGDEDGEDGEDDEAEDSEEREERERAHQAHEHEITSMVRSAETTRLRRPHVHPTIRVAGSASVTSPNITVASRPPIPPTSAPSPASRNPPQIQVLPASHHRATNNPPSNHVSPLNAPAHVQMLGAMEGSRLPVMTDDLTRLSTDELTTLRTFLARSNETVLRILDAGRRGPGLPISSIPPTTTTSASGAGVRMRPTLPTLMDNMPTTKQKTFPLQCGATFAIDPSAPKSAVEPSKQSGLGSGPRAQTALRMRRKANRASYPSSSYEFAMSSISPGGEDDDNEEDEEEDMKRIQKNVMRGKKVKTITNGCGALLHPSGYLSTARTSTLSLSNVLPTAASGITSGNFPNATTTTATVNTNSANTVANAAGVGLNEDISIPNKGVYIARGYATDAVVKLSRGYFEGSEAYCGSETCIPGPGARTSDACGGASSGYVGGYASSSAAYGAAGAPITSAKEGRMQCGCEWYGVGCRHCGLPLGEVYNACSRHVLPGSGGGSSSGGTTPSPTSSSPSVSPSRQTPEQQKEKVMKQQRRKGPTPMYTFDATSVTPRLPIEPEGGWERLQGASDDSNEEVIPVSPVNSRSMVPPPTATSPTTLSFASSPPPSPQYARNGPSAPSSPVSPSAPPALHPPLATQRASTGPTIRVMPVQQQRAGGPRSFGISMRSIPVSQPRQLPVPNTGMHTMQWSPSTYSGGSGFGGGAGFHAQTHSGAHAQAHNHVISPAPPRIRGSSHGSNSGSDTGNSDNSGSGSSLSASGSNTSSSAQDSTSPAGSGSATPASGGVRQNAAV